jgi:hypothetical protein
MASRLIPVKIGDASVLVEVAVIAGSEETSSGMTDRINAGYEHLETVILQMSESIAETIGKLRDRAAAPARVDVEFGLKFTAKGTVFVAEASGESAVKILISYDSARP